MTPVTNGLPLDELGSLGSLRPEGSDGQKSSSQSQVSAAAQSLEGQSNLRLTGRPPLLSCRSLRPPALMSSCNLRPPDFPAFPSPPPLPPDFPALPVFPPPDLPPLPPPPDLPVLPLKMLVALELFGVGSRSSMDVMVLADPLQLGELQLLSDLETHLNEGPQFSTRSCPSPFQTKLMVGSNVGVVVCPSPLHDDDSVSLVGCNVGLRVGRRVGRRVGASVVSLVWVGNGV